MGKDRSPRFVPDPGGLRTLAKQVPKAAERSGWRAGRAYRRQRKKKEMVSRERTEFKGHFFLEAKCTL